MIITFVLVGKYLEVLSKKRAADTLDRIIGTMPTEATVIQGDEKALVAIENIEPGDILELKPGEKVHDSNPARPNTSFDPFVTSILRQIGVALELPYEILVKHFTASYSAARAAMLDAWKFFLGRRAWLARSFCQPIYETWLTEAVALGRIAAPGFFTDPLIRKAWLGSEWVGPSRGQIDELKEIKAARERIAAGVSTISEVTAEMTGGDWERKHAQRVKEATLRQAAGLENSLDYESQKEPEARIEE